MPKHQNFTSADLDLKLPLLLCHKPVFLIHELWLWPVSVINKHNSNSLHFSYHSIILVKKKCCSSFSVHFATRPAGDASRGAELLWGRRASLEELAQLVHGAEGVVVATRKILAYCLQWHNKYCSFALIIPSTLISATGNCKILLSSFLAVPLVCDISFQVNQGPFTLAGHVALLQLTGEVS